MHKSVDNITTVNRSDFRVAIIAGQFNPEVTEGLQRGATRALSEAGVAEAHIDTYPVAGSFEVAELAAHLAKAVRYDAIIALGAIVKGETSHDEHLARAVTESILTSATTSGVPIGLGIITANTFEQAVARAADDNGNRGYHAVKAALALFEQMHRKL
ncbi:6,7-dimethyl-8-ribityllumazine synthase [Candidatus Uhrbacteria bacterium CG10_big_fil_rev_8_21_14_0_10_48_11]|uniref:6,7-dimethyl-8-ribityllumazine synthase n=1 Tax=Candidatus Uhrbacteria bacterium CG10_big_fil_rev_8_21_14_0_10_48_11 TaxID=1975037 RepID=A0A2M8LDH0_9BACT|nr:MAG: 6,7-dimethyl-8-ribityllumazine synthase [Candidatus Uhrbacteria bacterium CG10_big_fil_rev_8_21_14_0_10_48_11]